MSALPPKADIVHGGGPLCANGGLMLLCRGSRAVRVLEQPCFTATTALLNLILLRLISGEKPMMTAMRATLALLAAFALAGPNFASAQTSSAPGAKVYFINLKDGQEVTSPFLVQFGLSGMGVAPAGVEKPNTGHHHLLIDSTLSGEELKQPIPMDDRHRHFGNGQTEAMITLPPGKHTLQLVLGDWSHVPHVPPVMSDVIAITVH